MQNKVIIANIRGNMLVQPKRKTLGVTKCKCARSYVLSQAINGQQAYFGNKKLLNKTRLVHSREIKCNKMEQGDIGVHLSFSMSFKFYAYLIS